MENLTYTFKPKDVDLAKVKSPAWCTFLDDDELQVLIDGVERDLDEGTANEDLATAMIVKLYAEHHWRKARKL